MMLDRIARQVSRLDMYGGLGDICKDMYSRLLNVFPSIPLRGRGKPVCVKVRDEEDPFFIRIGTSDAFTLHELFREKEYEWAAGKVDGEVRTVVDLGGNIGASLRVWRSLFPSARYIVVEPDEGNMRLLERHCASFIGHVTPIRALIVAKKREVFLDRTGAQSAYRLTEHPDGHPVAAATMCDLIEDYGIGIIDVLKCDIEGTEAELFSASSGWIDRICNMVVEVHRDYRVDDLIADVERAGGGFRSVVPSPHRDGVIGFFGNRPS